MRYSRLGWVLWLIASASVFADETRLRFSGFGTVGVARSHNDQADYTTTFEQAEGVGSTTNKDYGLDSVFGIQADMSLWQGLTATAQVQSRRQAGGSATPYFEWANLKYQWANGLSARVGRVVAPMFMVSEARAIGYAQPAARLPPDVYMLNPITYVDGGGVTYQFEQGDRLWSINATAGDLDQEIPAFVGDIDVHYDARLLNVSMEQGASTWRAGYVRAMLDFDNPLLDTLPIALSFLDQFGVENTERFGHLAKYRDFKVDFYDAGYIYDSGDYIVQIEAVARRSESYIVTDNDAFSVLAGVRWQQWTPYLRYAHCNSLNDKYDVPILEGADFLTEFINLINDFGNDMKELDERKSLSVGTRWDVIDNVALKLQFDTVRKPAGSSAFFKNFTDEFVEDAQTFHIYSVTLDYVFN